MFLSVFGMLVMPLYVCGSATLDLFARDPPKDSSDHPNTWTIPLHILEHNWAYAYVGKDRQEFRVMFDTGSGNSWIPSYSPSDKVTGYNFKGKSLGRSSSVTYGSGVTDGGPWYEDDFSVGDVTADAFDFFVVNKTGKVAKSDANNGLVGLEYRTKASTGNYGFFETLIKQNKLKVPEISFFFARSRDKDGGEVVFGGRDKSKFTGDVVEAPVYEQGFWKFHVDGVRINGKDIPGTDRKAIADTGTAAIMAPLDITDKIHQRIPGAVTIYSKDKKQASYIYPCDTPANQLPSVVIAGKPLAIDPLDFFNGNVGTPHTGSGKAMCKSIILGNKGVGGWNLGVAFMRSWYPIFRWGDPAEGDKVGKGTAVLFARAKHSQ